jgi:asparagine synthase (glutamine-hydrolysing)
MFSPRGPNQSLDAASARFTALIDCQPNVSVEMEDFTAHVFAEPGIEVRHDRRNGSITLLDGEVYAPSIEALRADMTDGDFASAVKGMRGSFFILHIAGQPKRAIAATDRINSRKVFSGRIGEDFLISSSLSLWPKKDLTPDPTGVAWYLARNLIPAGRTIYQGVRLLERASLHTLNRNGWQSVPYWLYRFENAYTRTAESDLASELTARLDQAVALQTADPRTYFLSLSGGYDATAILGILAQRLGKRGIQCFSYARGNLLPGSDEDVAHRMATQSGYQHEVFEGYAGDLCHHIALNAINGEGMTGFCDEAQAWQTLQTRTDGVLSAILCGDECLGWTDYRLRSTADVLNSVQIGGNLPTAWAADVFEGHLTDRVEEEFAEDVTGILARCDHCDHLHDKKDFLYLDQRLPSTILQWRQRFAGRCCPVRNPLLDNEILDFMMRVPAKLRVQKRLFKRTVERLFPSLFLVPRAHRASYHIPLGRELAQHAARLLEWLSETTSPLDAVVSVAPMASRIQKLAQMESNSAAPTASLQGRMKQALRVLGVKDWMRPFVPPPQLSVQEPAFVVRWLVLRSAMQQSRRG